MCVCLSCERSIINQYLQVGPMGLLHTPALFVALFLAPGLGTRLLGAVGPLGHRSVCCLRHDEGDYFTHLKDRNGSQGMRWHGFRGRFNSNVCVGNGKAPNAFTQTGDQRDPICLHPEINANQRQIVLVLRCTRMDLKRNMEFCCKNAIIGVKVKSTETETYMSGVKEGKKGKRA